MKKLDARTKFMIADLFELRARKWKPRRDEKAPATIAQVRQQAAQEELNKRSASKNNSRSGHSKSHDRSSHNRGGSERRGGSFNMPTVFSSSSSSKKGSRSQNNSNTGRGQQSQSRNRHNNKSSGSRLNLQPQRGSRTTRRPQGDDSKKSTTTKPISVEEYKKKCKSTVNEYLCTLDVKEVKQCLAEYGQKDNSPFVKECLNIVIEASPREAQKLVADLSKLYSFLMKESSIRSVDLEKGFKSILGEDGLLDDMVIDIPQFPKFLGFFIAALISLDVIDLNMPVKQFHSSSIKSGMAQKILKYTLTDFRNRSSDPKLVKVLKGSSLSSVLGETSLESFLEDSCEMKDLVKML